MRSKAVILLLSLFVLLGASLTHGCRKTEADAKPLPFATPASFPSPVQNTAATEAGFQLGKKLFFDGRLAADGYTSCGSCHQPEAAFTTFEHDRSHGLNNSHTLRNAPALFNLAWTPAFNQDGGAATLADVFRQHLTNPDEMGRHLPELLRFLRSDDGYRRAFRAAFGNEEATEDKLYTALSQFVLRLVSAGAKYDRVKRGEASFTTQEQQGYSIFQARCATCHQEPLFTDFSYRNTGLPPDPALNDRGRRRVTNNPADDLKFRVPSLRNAEFTSYYGHDGRFSFFRMMILHYRTGVQSGPTLDPLLAGGIPLTTAEEDALVAFIRTLSDSTFLNNPRFRP